MNAAVALEQPKRTPYELALIVELAKLRRENEALKQTVKNLVREVRG